MPRKITHGFEPARLRVFDSTYDATRDDIAAHDRGVFLKAFPRKALARMKLADYVIGRKTPTFCAYVEAKTREWANIQGATSAKFGIYFGRTKSDPRRQYRFSHRFGQSRDEAFRGVKTALLDLVRIGAAKNLNFSAIDQNPLSQMFKAKILSLYFPDRFINVCSADHLRAIAAKLGFGRDRLPSECQNLLIRAKSTNPTTKQWSNPKFMSFLYATYLRAGMTKPMPMLRQPRRMIHRKVNFEDLQHQWGKIGKAAEVFALRWERRRLEGIGLTAPRRKITDRRDQPGYGYDFLSFSSQNKKRFIEVKAVGKTRHTDGYRFFLSDNERRVSESSECRGAYFFYLVFFNGLGKPAELRPILADQLYKQSEVSPASYEIRFQSERSKR